MAQFVKPSWLQFIVLLWVISIVGVAEAAICRMTPMSFDRQDSTISVGSFQVHLEGGDSNVNPTVWEGPIAVKRNDSGQKCALDLDQLIDRPFAAYANHILVVVTTSGSNFRLITIDLKNCNILNTTANLSGPIMLRNGRPLADGRAIAGFPCDRLE
jgi:hypothetical protein